MREEATQAWTERLTSFLGDAWPTKAPKLMSDRIRDMAIRGLGRPHNLTQSEVQEMSRSVIDHINQQRSY
jgi:hypothetical protein